MNIRNSKSVHGVNLVSALALAVVYLVLYGLSFVWTRSKENLSNADSSVVALTLGFPNSAAVMEVNCSASLVIEMKLPSCVALVAARF